MMKIIAPFLISLTFSQLSFASDLTNGCSYLHLQITNLTKNACILTSQKVNHGNSITAPPASIMPNDSKKFDMVEAFYGPDITLSYQCGDENITFTSSQSMCFLMAGNVSGEVLAPETKTVMASYTAIMGSAFWSRPGNINWVIQTQPQSQPQQQPQPQSAG